MPTTQLEAGEPFNLDTGNAGQVLYIEPSGGDIRIGRSYQAVRKGQTVEDGDRVNIEFKENSEDLWAYTTASGVSVFHQWQGFFSLFSPRKTVSVDQVSDFDVILSGSSVTQDVDVTAQTIADLDVFDRTNYPNANSVVASAYPISVNETWTIKELIVFDMPSDKTLDITTEGGSTVTGIEPKRASLVLDTIQIDSFDVKDPNGSGGETSLLWSGEA